MKRPNNRIWCLRKATGLTQKEFCDEFRIPRRTLQSWETEENHPKELTVRGLEDAVKTYLRGKELDDRTKN